MKNKFNVIAKCKPGQEYIILDMIATKLSKSQFENIKKYNEKLFENYHFIPYEETDFTWWSGITKKLTQRKITRAYFDIDFYGNVREVK